MTPTRPSERWRAAMRAWALPESILAAAPESPWGFPPELFRSRARLADRRALSFSNRRARELLPTGGSVLDVGVGGGAGSLPLIPPCAVIIGVDQSAELLAAFRDEAGPRGAEVVTIEGTWPDVAPRTPVADVVVCHHVAYNVADLAPFVTALTAHARRRVVMELTNRHPAAWMSDLWWRFHGLARPSRPDARDAVAVVRELGLRPRTRRSLTPRRPSGFARREDAIAWVRRRLCLPASQDPAVADALGAILVEEAGLWSVAPPAEPVVTLWWDTP